ncbi:MAG TPA: NAD-dependent epimerase/dehydratase family protein [Burkholderiales bacterium]|nr:NAD-dependent epimerase/dehydratase family protein [Burkholderiales bacterium]
MKILILGGDGYLGWPTAMYFSKRGHEVTVLDNFIKRTWEMERGVEPLVPITPLHQRVRIWKETTGKDINLIVGDLTNPRLTYKVLEDLRPDTIVHYAEQPSAPFSMIDRHHAVLTQTNNVVNTLNLVFAMKSLCPNAHLVKLGTMGEYGTPNIDIEEGFIEIEHKGRKDLLPFPKQPFSFYHLSKVHDTHNIAFACKIWGLKATDLNQGVVYGMRTDETELHPAINTSFHYDDVFGTVINRFCVQAVAGIPLTVYGGGNQRRTYLNVMDTLQCVDITVNNPPQAGEFRVFNQFTETFSINELAALVKKAGDEHGLKVSIDQLPNPRVEQDKHYYNPSNEKLRSLGLKPRKLSDVVLNQMLIDIKANIARIDKNIIYPKVKWHQK